MKMKLQTFWLLALLAGCTYLPLRPGIGVIQSSTGGGGFVRQSQNPQQESSQKYEKVTETVPSIYLSGPQSGQPVTNTVTRVTEKGETHIGAAQKDTARELGAKLGSLKGVVWVGVLVFLFGAVSFFYPPLKVIVGGSTTTSAVITAAGLALIILPTLIVGNEILILAVAGGAAGIYWFAHRHGSLKGALDTLKGK
jgi:hypothetical protein